MMTDCRSRLASIALLCLIASPLAAQDTTPSEGVAELPLGESVGAINTATGEELGETYVGDTFTDWELRCIRTDREQDPCQLYQLMSDGSGNPVAEINLFALGPDEAPAVAGATIVTPLETLLTQQVTMAVDGGQAKRYPFTFCSQIGCFARLGLTQEDIDAFKRGSVANLAIVPVAAPDQLVTLDISLAGFTAGYDAIQARRDN